MQIANIYPIVNQEMYRDEKYVMILAHLLKKGLYDPKNFSQDQYIIMDNGLFEGEQVSTDLEDLVQLAENSGIPIKEIIVPDAVNDCEKTRELFRRNFKTIVKYSKKYTFMFVAQALTYSELRQNILYINQYAMAELNLSVGISKLTPLDRADPQACSAYKHCKFPIHILGIKSSFEELNQLARIEQIRGCDTSQLAYIAKNEGRVPLLLWEYSREARKTYFAERGEERHIGDIQLETDCCDPELLQELKETLIWEVDVRGLL